MSFPCVPLATYRLQFNKDFGFRDAIGILDYLRDLGISHIYAAPILTSRSGSGHGYDVTDPTKIDAEIGGEEGFAEFRAAVEERGMGLVLDIVPNHMAASSENRWWMDVLEYGPDSPYAFYFDIDWRPPQRDLENKLLLPFLGSRFAEELEQGKFRIQYENGSFVLKYGEQAFPVAPASYAEILRYSETQSTVTPEVNSAAVQEWKGVIAVADSIAADHNLGTQAAAERRSKFEHMRERLRQLLVSSSEIASLLESTLTALNGTTGAPRSYTELERVLSEQHYRLAFWQTTSETINYRRFFSITDLVGVRVEDPTVFDSTHDAAIRLGFKPCTTGFRIDHIDGLRDPGGYLKRLHDRLAAQANADAEPYILVEKILEPGEQLPENWPVAGTTGYDYLNAANRLLVDENHSAEIRDVYFRWIGNQTTFEDTLYEKKKLVMRTMLGVEARSLGRLLAGLARDDRYAREIDPIELTEALVEVTACLPVYRTYIQTLDVPEGAHKVISDAVRAARKRRSNLPPACLDFLCDVLLLASPDHVRPEQREARLAFVTRWQQFTGPVIAKGLEDTALYTYFPLASSNEVGGDPRVVNTNPLAFHQFIAERQTHWRHTMNATTTHDTKRSEDVRARIAVLSEIPQEWERALNEWSRLNEKHRKQSNGAAVPDHNEEYFLYQTLIGTWPLCDADWEHFVPRLQDYVVKATREAAVHTRWTRPNQAHEFALRDFVAAVVDRKKNSEFCARFEQFQERTALYGMLNGLGQVVLKVAAPGVPDCYQGSDLWDFRLVDPDNRGPIDFSARSSVLSGLRASTNRESPQYFKDLLRNWRDGRVKLELLARTLCTRRKNPGLFLDGSYVPVEVNGPHPQRIVGFSRNKGDDWAIALVPRCLAGLQAPVIESEHQRFWAETSIRLPADAPKKWINVLAGNNSSVISARDQQLSAADAFAEFPVALLLPKVG